MLEFLRKMFGLPTKDEVAAAKAGVETVPYKLEPPVINNKTGDVIDPVVLKDVVNPQVTDAVTQPLVKKTRKPRVKKVEVEVKPKVTKPRAVKEKAAKPVAAKRTYRKSK